MVDMEMWDKIELLIDAKGLNWADLAQLIGVKDSRISKWRSGTGEVDRKQILRIAKVLETGVEYLADDSLEDPRAAQRLTEDEGAVIRFYRSKKAKGELDEADAIEGMAAKLRSRLVEPKSTGSSTVEIHLEPPPNPGTPRRRQGG